MDRPDQTEAQTIYARRKWSAQRLEIPLNASKKEARTQWLKGLEEADFLPDEIHLPAWRIVTDEESAAAARQKFPHWSSHFDDEMGQEIESFAQRFFSLDPAERRKEFTRLNNACRDNPRHQKRISSLSPALKLPRAATQNDDDDENAELMLADVEELSQHLRSLFVAKPPIRARIQLEFLREHAYELPRWGMAAKALKESHPELVAIVPEHWEELTGCDVRQQQAASFQAGLEERVALQALETRREESASRSDSGSFLEGLFFNRYAMFAAVWIAIKVVGALMSSSSSTPRSSTHYPHSPAPQVKLEDYLSRFDDQRQKNKEERRWVIMDEEEFKASHGEERVKSLGLKKEREEYWQWKRKLIAYEIMLEEAIEKRNEVQNKLDQKEHEEKVLRTRLHTWQKVTEKTTQPSQKSTAPDQTLQDTLEHIQTVERELSTEVDRTNDQITRLRVIIAALNTGDPSIKPLDASP